jgi:uncharacterized protein (TIGR02271 family)
MSRSVTALYSSRAEAEEALAALAREVPLAHGEIVERHPNGAARLDHLDLTREERAACERQMESGEHLLLAQVRTGEDPEHIIAALERIADEREARGDFAGSAAAGSEAVAGTADEQRIPLVQEELRIGTREVVRGGARVSAHVEEIPVTREVELIEEEVSVERRPATRRVEEAELAQGQLLRERVIEVTQIREEAVVSKEAFVREEVVVKKNIHRRTEQITDTVRRTEVDAERLGPNGRPAFSGLHGDGRSDPPR